MEESLGVRKGAWCKEEDDLLRACVRKYGEGKWHLVPTRAGLNRCRKSCRLRWLNYLKPSIKRGVFSEDEVDMMKRVHRLLGNRWSLIAGRLPGRTPNDVKNFWNSNTRRKVSSSSKEEEIKAKPKETMKPHQVIRPQPRTFSSTSPWLRRRFPIEDQSEAKQALTQACAASSKCNDSQDLSGETIMGDKGGNLENDKWFLSEQDWKLLEELDWVEELPVIEDQSWSDFLLDVSLWDS